MLYRKEANSRGRKSNIENGGGGSILEMRKEICLKYSNMAKCLNTFVTHCSPHSLCNENIIKDQLEIGTCSQVSIETLD